MRERLTSGPEMISAAADPLPEDRDEECRETRLGVMCEIAELENRGI
jgi:hypothetical protein